jgi:probable phosphoglycerate mutase
VSGGERNTAGAEGVLRTFGSQPGATQIVLIRHGEAVCNVEGVVGGKVGCRGLTEVGRRQAASLAERLRASGELRSATALYSSVLPRAVETAQILRDAIGPAGTPFEIEQQCELCELHPGDSDNLTWQQVIDTFGVPDWNVDDTVPIAPGGESWASFRPRAAAAVHALARRHPGELVVAVVHAGVIEATMIEFLGINPDVYKRGWLRIPHASMTTWEWVPGEARWVLVRFSDGHGVPASSDARELPSLRR